jgi:hypothetical protein
MNNEIEIYKECILDYALNNGYMKMVEYELKSSLSTYSNHGYIYYSEPARNLIREISYICMCRPISGYDLNNYSYGNITHNNLYRNDEMRVVLLIYSIITMLYSHQTFKEFIRR